MLKFIFAVGAVLALAGCGHYRSTNQGWRSPSDYSRGDGGAYVIQETVQRGQSFIPTSAFRLYWPVKNVRLNRGYRPRSDRSHQGVDLGGTKGTPILAAHEGVVIYAGDQFRGYGKMVMIEYNKSWATLYSHLDSFAVKEGRIVRPGDPIGGMGRTGKATGVHLHFELIKDRQPVDPLPFLTRNSHMASR